MRLSTIADFEIFAEKLVQANIELPENLIIEFTEQENKDLKSIFQYYINKYENLNVMSIQTQFVKFKIMVR